MTERKLVLVTGAARRLGRAIALELATHGWNIALHYHRSLADAERTLAELRAAGARAEGFAADLADEAQCEALVPAVVQRLGALSAVVNNASRFEHDDVTNLNYEQLSRHWRSNTAPAIVLARALHAHRLATAASGDACVVNLLDQKLFNPNPDHLSYTLSKAALHAATPLLAQALAPVLRVCGVAPGLTLDAPPQIDAERLAALKAQGPLARGAEGRDVAHAVRFTLENPSITGSTVLVDAGNHLVRRARDFAFADPPP